MWRFLLRSDSRPIYSPRRLAMVRRTNHDLTDVEGQVVGETEKGFKFYNGSVTEWLPKSQVEWDEESKIMTMPEWLANEKGFI